jgi:hypothetical protein
MYVPAAAVVPRDGQDYAAVPREPAEPPARYVFDNETHDGEERRMRLHVGDCPILDRLPPGVRITPIEDVRAARCLVEKFHDTVACEVCKPNP